MNLAVFISGRGSDFRAILNAIDEERLDAQVTVVVSNNANAPGLQIAQERGIPAVVLERDKFPDGSAFGFEMLSALRLRNAELIVLAGYVRKIPSIVLKEFPRRVINIHPALLPRHGGKGMYGHFVHEAVLAAGEKESGVTVHYVDELYDHGEIIAQRSISGLPEDTADSLAQRILNLEHEFYPEVLQQLVKKLSKP